MRVSSGVRFKGQGDKSRGVFIYENDYVVEKSAEKLKLLDPYGNQKILNPTISS